MSDAQWRDRWMITRLISPKDPYDGYWLCVIERPQTKTAIHAPGGSAEAAMAEAWRLAGLVEGAK